MKKLSLKRLLLFLFCLALNINLISQIFTEQTSISLPGVSNGSVAWGDYDNDGNIDILIAGIAADNSLVVKVFRNNGNNTFSDLGSAFTPAIPSNIGYCNQCNCKSLWGDFDNDGYIDIIFISPLSSGSRTLMIYRNNGNSTFTLKTTISTVNVYGNSIDIGDYDNDGDLDILLSTSQSSKILQNEGNFIFTEQLPAPILGLKQSSSKWGDYDNDGDLDILITGQIYYTPYSIIYQNQGNNTFSRQTGISISGVYSGSGEWGDYNGDGLIDILLTGNYNSSIYKNNGNNTFTYQSGISLKGLSNTCGKWGDLDNDGDLDIVLAGNYNGTPVTLIYLNNGNNTFSEQTSISLTGVYDGSIDLGDYDNDGDLDIVISGNTGTTKVCKIYRNGSSIINPVPVAPIGLVATAQGSDMILKWKPVTTDNTFAKSISYNLMVGTTAGGIDLVAPSSSTTTGFRKISGMGNGQLDTTFILRNINKTTYYWKVQAVDNSFKGSPFSSQSTFTYSSSYQAYGLNISNLGGKESTLAWSRGNGGNCIVFMKEGSTGTVSPSNNTTYSASSLFKSGSPISDWYCIYKGTQNSVHVSGLTAGTNYIYQVIEFDGNSGAEQYSTQTSANNPFPFKTGYFTELTNVVLQSVNTPSLDFGQYSSSTWVDIDNDNDLDLLLSGSTGTYLYRNDGNDVFTLLTFPSNGNTSFSTSCGDYNNDGFNDILINNDLCRIFKNNSNNTFSEQTAISLPGSSYGWIDFSAASWGDYDNDGDLDVIITGRTTSEGPIAKIFRNNGNNTFTEQPLISLTGVYAGSAKWCDFDNDGFLDLLIAGMKSDATTITKVYRNNGNNDFIEQTAISLTGFSFGMADFGDYDNDGYMDIILSGQTNSGAVSKIYHNNGNFAFTEQTTISLAKVQNSSVAWGDYDNDGDLDILISGITQDNSLITKIYSNNGDNTFTEDLSCSFPGVGFGSATWVDYDNDGDLDIVLTGVTANGCISRIFRNDITVPNVKPAAPTGLASTVNKSDAILKWKSVRTDATSYKAMSYNVKVGTLSGGINVVSPHSLSNGYRKLTGLGNGNLDTTFYLKNLPFGTYYWSVQAVDNGFAGGPFSSEGTFSIVPVQAKNLSAKIVDKNTLWLKWERGNGDRCIVFCKQTSSGTATPVNNTGYIPDNGFGYGGQIGSTGWYCVYDGRADSVTVTGLTYNQNYSFQVIEYMGTLGSEQYFTDIINGNPGVFSTGIFSEQTGISLTNAYNNPVAWGDYDNDGFLDLLIPGIPSKIYHNNGDNTFTELTGISIYGVANGSAAWSDYDNDGDLDFILTGSSTYYPATNPVSKIYRNDGNGIFTEQTQITLTGVQYSSVALGDYNNDGYIDILLSGAAGNDPVFNPVSKIYRNNGDGTFTEQTQISLSGAYKGAVAWADYDNDGDLDIIITGSNTNQPYSVGPTKIYRNDGNSTFTEQTQISLKSVYQSSVAWGDFDNDDDLDLIITDLGNMTIYKNLGNNTFTTLTSMNYGFMFQDCAVWGDYDNDGYLDILFSNSGLSSDIFKNLNGSAFGKQNEESILNVGFSFITWCDYDNDGDLDILFADGTNSSKIYRNNSIMKSGLFKPNVSPAAPTGITKEYSPSGIKLKWSPVKNDETPWKSMSYNVRIGTRKDSDNICPSHSSSTGFRKIPAIGNAQIDTSFFIKNLSSRKYYWSVQAVDQGYKGGAWAIVDSFDVKNVQAFFKADTVCQGLATHFTDQSVATDGIASWKWDFKDGTTSTLHNPSHVFLTGGTYNVKLVIKSTGGVKDSLEKNTIVKLKPTTGFTAPATCQGTSTTITNTTNNNGLTISSWYWNFGDGQNSTAQQPPAHGYLGSGNYTVLLKALASNGCIDSTSKTVSVASYPVAAVTANAPLTFCKGDSVTLSVGKNSNYNYKWLLNGSSLTNGDSSKFVAKLSGNYTVEVTNKTASCKTTSDQAIVTAQNAPVAPLISTGGPTLFCQGDSVTLSISSTIGYSYQWKQNGGSVGTSQNTLIAKSTGLFSVTVTNSFGCSANSTNTINVIVNPKPNVPTVSISGATSFCQGNSVDLSVINNSAYSYQWQNTGSNISGATLNAYTATSSGVYSLNVTNSSGCVSKTENVTVITLIVPNAPLISAGSATQFCQGDSVILSVTNTTGYTYQWKLNGGAVGSNSNQYTAKSAGTYSLVVSNSFGCAANSTNTVNVVVNSKPTVPNVNVSGTTSFCQGGSVDLSVTNNLAYNYQWKNNSTNISGANTYTYSVQNSGVYSLNITNSAGCSSKTDNVTVNVTPSPTAPLISSGRSLQFCQGDSVTLSVTNTTGYTNQWKLNGGAVGLNSNNYAGKSSGTYSLVVSNTLGCTANSINTINLVVNPKPTLPTVNISGPTSFCQGGNVQLSVTNNISYTYQWQNNNANISGAITNTYIAQNSGVYSLNISNSNGCVTRTENVTVNSLTAPSAPSISASGALQFCQGDSVTLSVTNTTGYTYQWKLNGGAVGSNSNTFVTKNSGSYNLVVSNTNSCSASSSNFVNVVVNSLPSVSAVTLSGPTTFCSGGTITLSVPSTSGYSYNWRNENGLISGAITYSYVANTSGKYQVDISNSPGCVVKTSQVNVVVKTMPVKPVITSDNYQAGKCMGEDPIRLNASQAVTGYNYQWYKNGIPVSGATSSTYEDFLSQGDYTLEADLGGCKSLSDILNVYFENAPDKPLIYAEGPTVWYLACSNDSASQYKWYYNGTIIQGADKYIYVANKNLGKYAVSIANTKGCFTRSDVITIPTGATGIKDIDPFAGLKIYPNPTPGLFTIEMDNQIFGELLINIIAQEGKEILKIKFEKTTVHFSSQINLSGQPKGMYLINLLTDKYIANRKVIVE